MDNSGNNLERYHRRLPHWRLRESVYFVTWRLHKDQTSLLPIERDLVKSALFHFDKDRYDLIAWVVMHDHVHVITCSLENYRLEDIVHSWKSYSANSLQRRFGRRNRIWQDEYFDRIIRDQKEFLEKAQDILNNPWKTWTETKEYLWVGYKEAGTEARPTGTETRPIWDLI
jgi:putative transposase